MKWNTDVLHITNGNCKMPYSDILGYTKPCSGLRPLQGFVPPHFCSPAKPTVSLIRAAKTSVTWNVKRQLHLSKKVFWVFCLTKHKQFIILCYERIIP